MNKILVIGIDGGSWSVINEAVERGYMPQIESYLSNGSSGKLFSTIPSITPAAWGSFQTGVSPAMNSVFDFSFFDKQARKKKYVTSDMLQKTMWEFISQAGGKVSAVNVPMTYPPYPVNGYLVSGITTPSENSEFTYPSDFKKEIFENIPDYHIFTVKNIKNDFIHKNMGIFINELKDIILNRTKLAKLILKKQPHNLFMVHFQATDVLQHVLWPYLDKNSPFFDESKFDYILREFYGYLDLMIKDIVNEFETQNGDDFVKIILSDHGFEEHKCRINLGNWLVKNGYTQINKTSKSALKKITSSLNAGKTLKKIIGEDKTLNLEKKVGIRKEFIDWENSSVIATGKSGEGYIYILNENPVQRSSILKSLSSELKRLKYNGLPVVKDITEPKNIYLMDCPDTFPDLFVLGEPGFSFSGDIQRHKELFSPINIEKDFHMGKHSIEGIVIISGEKIEHNKISANILDIMPTVLGYLGIEIPEYIQGRCLDVFKSKIDIKISKQQLKHIGNTAISTEDDAIEKRLNDLGYM